MLIAVIALAFAVALLFAIVVLLTRKTAKLNKELAAKEVSEIKPAVMRAEDIKGCVAGNALTKSLRVEKDCGYAEEPVAVIENSANFNLQAETEECAIDKAVNELSLVQMTYFTAIISAFETFKRTRVRKSECDYCLLQGNATVARLHITTGILCLDCYVDGAEVREYGHKNLSVGTKPVRIKITDNKLLENALCALKIAADNAYEARFGGERAAN